MNITAKEITQNLAGEWRGNCGLAPCPICQGEGRRDQRALSIKDAPCGNLLLFCFKGGCGFENIARALHIAPERQATRAEVREEMDRDKERKRAKAGTLFKETREIPGTPAELYLHNRGITIPMHPHVIRYHSRLYHPSGTHLPALVGKVVNAKGQGIAIQRIYVTPGGDKTNRNPAKAALGPIKGGAVRLGDGPEILLGEGIETVAAAMQLSCVPGYAALSTGGMKAFEPPPHVQQVTLLMDVDANGAGEAACADTSARLRRMGITTRTARPASGAPDFNDELLKVCP